MKEQYKEFPVICIQIPQMLTLLHLLFFLSPSVLGGCLDRKKKKNHPFIYPSRYNPFATWNEGLTEIRFLASYRELETWHGLPIRSTCKELGPFISSMLGGGS